MKMTEYRRSLMLEVFDNQKDVIPWIFHLQFNYRDCDSILKKLIDLKLTGTLFIQWLKYEHDNSPLCAFNDILRKINNDKKYLTLAQRDFFYGNGK